MNHGPAGNLVTVDLLSKPLPTPALQSFFLGGFECATHRRRDHARMDVVERSRHDKVCAADYELLAQVGIRTVRDGLRWHLIEKQEGVYDWSSFLPMLDSALSTGTQVIWDLCHWGVPDGLDPFSPEFGLRFARFAAAAAELARARAEAAGSSQPALYCAINEISFWSWIGAEVENFFPYCKGQGARLKRCLSEASILAMRAVRQVDPEARFVQAEPLIRVSADPKRPEDREYATTYTAGQFEVWDTLVGRRDVEFGGAEGLLDIVGVNYYWDNQWVLKGGQTPPGNPLHRPLHQLLIELWQRYRKPILITETGAEGDAAFGWLGYITAEVRQAMRSGVSILGICLYPVMDYPGWDDDRHCRCGLIACSDDWTTRTLRSDLVEELAVQQRLFAEQTGVAVAEERCEEELATAIG